MANSQGITNIGETMDGWLGYDFSKTGPGAYTIHTNGGGERAATGDDINLHVRFHDRDDEVAAREDFDLEPLDARVEWDRCEGGPLRVLDENNCNVEAAQIRRFSDELFIYVDDVDGFRFMAHEEALCLSTVELNSTQVEILDRLANGEGPLHYHPQSVYGGEVQPLRDMGLIDTSRDEDGLLYIVRPGEGDEE